MASGGSGVKQQGFANVGRGQNLFGDLTNNANAIYGGLAPTLEAESAHPQGLTPQAKASINTAAQQSGGGSTAGAIGAGKLYSARTRNAGGAKAAVGEGVRAAGKNLSDAALNTEITSAKLANQQQEQAQRGLQGLYGTELSGGENALGLSNQALGITNQAKPSFWQQIATTGAKNLVNAGLDAAEAGSGIF